MPEPSTSIAVQSCAGGTVVTLTDEGTNDARVTKRRQQKIYSDVLDRTVKTEILNWQNGMVYSTTVNTYNARNQVTQIRQYAGPEGSGTHQDTTDLTLFPQNTKILVSEEEKKAYRGRIAETLKNKECADFIKQLLNEAKVQTGKAFGDVLTRFDAMRFYWANLGGSYGGHAYWEGMGTVRAADISNTINTEKMDGSPANQASRRAFLISQTTHSFLADTLHHLSQGVSMYRDGEMANALKTVLVGQGLDTHKTFSDQTHADT